MLCLKVQYLLGYRIGTTSRGSTLYASNSWSLSKPGFGSSNSLQCRDLQGVAHHLNWIAQFVIVLVCTFTVSILHCKGCRSCPKQQKLSVQSCLQKLCRKPLPGLSSFVYRSRSNTLQKLLLGCRFLPVETVLESSVHVMFMSLFWDLMSAVFTCN